MFGISNRHKYNVWHDTHTHTHTHHELEVGCMEGCLHCYILKYQYRIVI